MHQHITVREMLYLYTIYILYTSVISNNNVLESSAKTVYDGNVQSKSQRHWIFDEKLWDVVSYKTILASMVLSAKNAWHSG